jgi:hypothetical protein
MKSEVNIAANGIQITRFIEIPRHLVFATASGWPLGGADGRPKVNS